MWERGSAMVLAAHHTPCAAGGGCATTVAAVRFTRSERIDFRLVRGPAPHVTDEFQFIEQLFGSPPDHSGELGTDLWALGQ